MLVWPHQIKVLLFGSLKCGKGLTSRATKNQVHILACARREIHRSKENLRDQTAKTTLDTNGQVNTWLGNNSHLDVTCSHTTALWLWPLTSQYNFLSLTKITLVNLNNKQAIWSGQRDLLNILMKCTETEKSSWNTGHHFMPLKPFNPHPSYLYYHCTWWNWLSVDYI